MTIIHLRRFARPFRSTPSPISISTPTLEHQIAVFLLSCLLVDSIPPLSGIIRHDQAVAQTRTVVKKTTKQPGRLQSPTASNVPGFLACSRGGITYSIGDTLAYRATAFYLSPTWTAGPPTGLGVDRHWGFNGFNGAMLWRTNLHYIVHTSIT